MPHRSFPRSSRVGVAAMPAATIALLKISVCIAANAIRFTSTMPTVVAPVLTVVVSSTKHRSTSWLRYHV